ncbi:MAG: hypothetical protein PHU80_03535 [Kiritimatiellae bacterium]|nr:hypothetical protein [Kiritimatiellia bacterium]
MLRKGWICGLMFLAASAATVNPAHAQARNTRKVDPNENKAVIMFPAKGNLDVTNGTIEAVFCLAYSLGDQFSAAGSGRRLFALLSTHNEAGERYDAAKPSEAGPGLHFNVYLGQYQSRDHISITSSLFERPQKNRDPARYVTSGFPKSKEGPYIKAGAWHSLAVTWRLTNETHTVEFYVDGKRVSRSNTPHRTGYSTLRMADGDLLAFGYPGQMYGSLQSVRISSRVRTAEEIAASEKAGLAKDDATLLFFNGADILKMKTGNISQIEENKSGRTLRVPPTGMVFGKLKRVTGRNNAPAAQFREILP